MLNKLKTNVSKFNSYLAEVKIGGMTYKINGQNSNLAFPPKLFTQKFSRQPLIASVLGLYK